MTLKNLLFQTILISSIEKATYKEIRSWIVFLVEQSNSKRTINRKISVLASYYKFFIKD